VTGTSVLGIIFKDGVMLAADTLGADCSSAAMLRLCRTEPSSRFTYITVLKLDVCQLWLRSLCRIIWVHEAVQGH